MMKRASAVFAAAMLALTGCSGEDGDPGAAGKDGSNGTSCTVQGNGDGTSTVTCEDGTVATIADGTDGTNGTNGQSCTLTSNADGTRTLTCAGGSVIVLPAPGVAGKVAVSNAVATHEGADVVITFNLELNGASTNLFTNKVGSYRHTYNATSGEGSRVAIATSAYTVAVADGTYTVRIPGMATTSGATPTTYMIRLNTGAEEPQAVVVAHSPAGAPKSTVSDQACLNCHGNNVFWAEGEHHGANPQGVGACVVCHVTNSNSRGQNGDRLKSYVHGIHNSHNMPARSITAAEIDPDGSRDPLPPVAGPFTVAKPAGVYARNDSLNFVDGTYPAAPVAKLASTFSIGFPSYMNNCSTCHDTDANLAMVLDKPVTYSTCLSCHDSWGGFGAANTGTPEAPVYSFGGTNHASFTGTTNCAACHDGSFAPAKVSDFHGKAQAYTERNGLLYDGKDQSIVQGKLIRLEIAGVTPVAATAPVTNVALFNRALTTTVGTTNYYTVTATTDAEHGLASSDYVTISTLTGTHNFSGGSKLVQVASPTTFQYLETVATTATQPFTGDETPGSARTVTQASTLDVAWKAYNTQGTASTADDTEYDPCNTDVAAAPVFMDLAAVTATGQSSSNMTFLQAYAQGNDWVSAGIGTAPGQPITSATLSAAGLTLNTTCTGNVATSKVVAATTTATKGVLGLQGKPQVTFTSGTYTRVIQVRSPSPTREFVTATGAEPTDKRRAIADTAKCLTCHQGSLYQHGGNRVDSVDLCVMCHNPAANEKNVRVNMGVSAAEAFDGKPGQTYDLRYMLHAIHSAGETNAPLIFYRTNGIYAFGSEASIAALPNWPGAGCFDVYGSDKSATSGSASTGTQCGDPAPAAGAGIPAKKTHNEIVVHYPRALNDCGACHTSNAVALPSTTQAVAVTTYDAGASWPVQTDDVLMSPATATCMSCHQSGDAATQAALRAHAFQNSWTPAVFTNGRQDILGGGAAESCLVCHGAGKTYDYNAKHGN